MRCLCVWSKRRLEQVRREERGEDVRAFVVDGSVEPSRLDDELDEERRVIVSTFLPSSESREFVFY